MSHPENDDQNKTIELAVPETEAALLGAFMLDNRLLDIHSDRLSADHFHDTLHQRIYRVLLLLRNAGEAATPVTARPYFAKDPLMIGLGGPGYLAQLTGSGGGLIGAATFVTQIIEWATYRKVRDGLQTAIDKIEAAGRPAETMKEYMDGKLPDIQEIVSDTSAEINAATEAKNPHRIVRASKLLKRVRERRQRAMEGGSLGAICATISDLNDLIGAAAPGQMTMIGGRPGMGKSVFAQSMAWGYARNGHPTLMISLEMTEEAQAMRLSADLTFGMNEPVSFKRITRNLIDEDEMLTIDEAGRRVEQLPLEMIAPGRVTVEQIEAIVVRHVAALARKGQKLEVLVIDYAQIIAATGRLEGRERIDHISERVQGIAIKHGLHVFLLSQLVRDIDKRPDKRPTPGDLKESGRLEEDADNVLLLYRPEFYQRREEPKREDIQKWEAWNIEFELSRGRADLIGDKTRYGEPGTKRMRFYGDNQAMRGSDFRPPDFTDEEQLLPAQIAFGTNSGP